MQPCAAGHKGAGQGHLASLAAILTPRDSNVKNHRNNNPFHLYSLACNLPMQAHRHVRRALPWAGRQAIRPWLPLGAGPNAHTRLKAPRTLRAPRRSC